MRTLRRCASWRGRQGGVGRGPGCGRGLLLPTQNTKKVCTASAAAPLLPAHHGRRHHHRCYLLNQHLHCLHYPPPPTTSIGQAAADVDSTSEEIRAKNNIKQKGDALPWEVSEEKSIVQDDLMEQVQHTT